MTQNEKVLDKVKKLLTKADSSYNSNENECEAAMLKAQSLLAEAGLSMEDLSDDVALKEIIETLVMGYGSTIWWKKALARIICANFRCISFIRKIKGKTSIGFIGLKEDAEIAKSVYQFASKYLDHSAGMFMLKNPAKDGRAGIKNNFFKGFLKGLEDKYAEQVKNNNWGLVIVKDKVVDEYVENMKLKKSKTTTYIAGSNDQAAKLEGYKAGKSFNVPVAEIK